MAKVACNRGTLFKGHVSGTTQKLVAVARLPEAIIPLNIHVRPSAT